MALQAWLYRALLEEPPQAAISGRLEPGTSSLSGMFAGCVQAARALGDQVIDGVRVTVAVRLLPHVSVRCGT